MKRKIVGILVMMLLTATAVLPVVGTINEIKERDIISLGGPNIEWEFLTGGPLHDFINTIYETEDGGFIATGITEDPNDVYSAWVIKLDAYGSEEWRNIETEIQGTDLFSFGITSIAQTHDGGYIVLGACDRIEDLKYGFLWKLSEDGETEWFNSAYSGTYQGKWYVIVPWDIMPVVNGYLVTGAAYYGGEYFQKDVDAFLMKTDLDGNEVWTQIYRYGDFHDEGKAICKTLDGGYIIFGTVNTELYGIPSDDDSDIWLIKTDSEGNKEWDKTYGGSNDEWVLTRDICMTDDGGIITNSMTSSFDVTSPSKWNIWLHKFDSNGNELWNRTYGERNQGDSTWGMDKTTDGGFVIAATKNHNGFATPKDSIWIFKTDENGNVEWSTLYGGDKTERGYNAQQTTDGGYIVSGATESSGAGSWDGIIIKYSAFDNNRPNKPETPTGDKRGEPETEYTFTSTASEPDGEQIYYRWDWGDGTLSDWLGPYSSDEECSATYSWAEEDKFDIRVIVKDEHGGESDWSDPFTFSTPKNKDMNLFPILIWRLIERFPFLESLL